MPYRLALAVGLPILWWQGRRVKRDTPRLPEAAGARVGVSGAGQPLRVLILGDSAAAGVGVSHQDEALLGQILALLTPHYRVFWQLHATSGFRLSDVYQSLEDLQGQPFDVVLLSVGVNDVTAFTPQRRWIRQYQQLIEHFSQQSAATQLLCTAVPPMYAFSALPQPLRYLLGQRARLLNRALSTLLDCYPQAHLLDLALPLTPDMLAADGFHPSRHAYQRWAAVAASQISSFFEPID
jgi:lysophospholipase L1-like esterase